MAKISLPVVGAPPLEIVQRDPKAIRGVRHALPAPEYSPFKVIHHPERLAALRKGWRFPPAHVNLDLTSGPCSHRCVYCAPPDEVAVVSRVHDLNQDGYVRHDAVKVGMLLRGGDGNPRVVLATHAHEAMVSTFEMRTLEGKLAPGFRVASHTPLYRAEVFPSGGVLRRDAVAAWRVNVGDFLFGVGELSAGYALRVTRAVHGTQLEPVIGITVDGDHTYCIGSAAVVSHNCVGTDPRGFGMDTAERHSDKGMDDLVLFPEARLLPMLGELIDVGCDAFEFTGLSSEPTLHPGFLGALQFLQAKGKPYGVITNGDRLKRKVGGSGVGMDFDSFRFASAVDLIEALARAAYCRVSIDSLREDVDRRIRNPRDAYALPLRARLEGLRELADTAEELRSFGGGDCTVGMGVVVQRANIENRGIGDLLHWAFHAGVQVVRLVWVQGDEKLRRGLLREEDMAEARRQVAEARAELDGKVRPGFSRPFRIFGPGDYDSTLGAVGAGHPGFDKAYSACRYVRFVCNITATGDVYGCCQQRDVGRLKYGNLVTQSAAEVFYGAERERVLGSIDVNHDPVCASCIWDRQNEAIEYAVGEGKHAEFV